MIFKKVRNRLIIYITKMIIKCHSAYYNAKNKNNLRVFVFTDSRGYEVTNIWNKRNPFSSYVGQLLKEYNVEYHICEYSSTTIIDFLYEYKRQIAKGKKYDYVIAHVGLVDFSPRPQSMCIDIINEKKHKIEYLGWDVNTFNNYIKHPVSEQIYNGEILCNLYSLEYFSRQILPEILEIPNLIYVGCNKILSEWRGNYWQDRPRDISSILMQYNQTMLDCLNSRSVVDIQNWQEREIKLYTVDNIHLSSAGYDVLTQELKRAIYRDSKR